MVSPMLRDTSLALRGIEMAACCRRAGRNCGPLMVNGGEVLGVISMHILMRRSSALSTSQALAWQTTSRSRGLRTATLPECRRQRRDPNDLKNFGRSGPCRSAAFCDPPRCVSVVGRVGSGRRHDDRCSPVLRKPVAGKVRRCGGAAMARFGDLLGISGRKTGRTSIRRWRSRSRPGYDLTRIW